MLTRIASDASLKSPGISKTFGKNSHRSLFKPQVRSRSTIEERGVDPLTERKQEYQRSRDLSPIYQAKSQGLQRLKEAAQKGGLVGRPPAMASDEIRKMMAKYPETSHQADKDIMTRNRSQLDSL